MEYFVGFVIYRQKKKTTTKIGYLYHSFSRVWGMKMMKFKISLCIEVINKNVNFTKKKKKLIVHNLEL
jgi:hypothetical protein